jgi:hypothetical protein
MYRHDDHSAGVAGSSENAVAAARPLDDIPGAFEGAYYTSRPDRREPSSHLAVAIATRFTRGVVSFGMPRP